jgi:hypothetical protein
MNKKIFAYGARNLFFAFAVIFALALATAACDNGTTTGGGGPAGDPNTYTGYDGDGNQYELKILKTASGPVHTHTFSATWSSNATQHWHECTANDGEKTDVANHTFNGNICSVCNYNNGGGGGGGNGLTITGLPNGMYTLWIFEAGTNVSDLSAINAALDAGKAVAEGQNLGGNVFLIFGDSDTPTIWKGSGNLPVVLHNNASARYATVNFINGNATVPFSSFTLVGDGGGHTHTYSSTWSSNATQHWRECIANDGATDYVGSHTGSPCTVCGYSSGGGVHTHTWGGWQGDATQHWKECIANDGAITDEGSHTGDPCNVCGYSSDGFGNRDSRLINWADDAWIDSYPPGERDGFIFKENGTFQFIDDYTVTWGEFAVFGGGTWSTSGNDRLTLFVNAAYEAYSETYSYFVAGTDLTLTNYYGDSQTFTKTTATVSGRSVGFTAPAGKAGTKAVSAIKRAVAIGEAASLTANRAAAPGDKFTITMKNASGATVGTSTGTVDAISNNGETLTLDHTGGKFTTKIKGQAIAELPDPIPLDGGGTLPAPGKLTPTWTKPTNPGGASGLTITGLPSGQWMVYVFPAGTDISNYDMVSILSNLNKIEASNYGSNSGDFSPLAGATAYGPDGSPYTGSGSRPVAINESTGAQYYWAMVNFTNGNATVSFSSFAPVGGGGAGGPTNWIAVTDSPFGTSDNSINGIAYGGNKFVAVGNQGKIAYSSDGITWTAVANSTFSSTSSIGPIAYGNGRFVAVRGGGYGNIAYSDDGINWTVVSIPSGSWYAIAYGSNRFVIAGGEGKMAYSTDGTATAWTAVADSKLGTSDNKVNDIAYGNNRFVAVGDKGKMAYSSDGISWTAV